MHVADFVTVINNGILFASIITTLSQLFDVDRSTIDDIYFKKQKFLIKNLARSHGLSLNGTGDLQVDLLDIPGKGRCCVFISRFSYDPPE